MWKHNDDGRGESDQRSFKHVIEALPLAENERCRAELAAVTAARLEAEASGAALQAHETIPTLTRTPTLTLILAPTLAPTLTPTRCARRRRGGRRTNYDLS